MAIVPAAPAKRQLVYLCVNGHGQTLERLFHDDLEAQAFGRSHLWVKKVYRAVMVGNRHARGVCLYRRNVEY